MDDHWMRWKRRRERNQWPFTHREISALKVMMMLWLFEVEKNVNHFESKSRSLGIRYWQETFNSQQLVTNYNNKWSTIGFEIRNEHTIIWNFKAVQMQPMWLCICSGWQFEEIFDDYDKCDDHDDANDDDNGDDDDGEDNENDDHDRNDDSKCFISVFPFFVTSVTLWETTRGTSGLRLGSTYNCLFVFRVFLFWL